ncbi:hypothetical protein SLEP1_g6861 [Rubroshorea leprosula]|uniref:Threonylcarbamoyl-AMP synthase n=1 Tax=Rubroshorea leprosula TaxID=152421 RepID=A0AAV5I6E3_9ROSI|nr:hypothetical protein SLEP1_g6861 [Rubroshorea leprosula]
MVWYAIVCHLKSDSAIEHLRRIKNIEPSKPLSILCHSFRDIDTYTMGFPGGDGQGHANLFRAVKRCLPGPYTFILTASKALPKQCIRYGTTTAKYASRKNVGVRIPDDPICQAILEKMDAPLICTSVKSPKENEWMIDPVVIVDIYGPKVWVCLHSKFNKLCRISVVFPWQQMPWIFVSPSFSKFVWKQYTFILTASKALPKQCIRYGTTTAKYASRKNVGVRIPDDPICQAILEKMDAPLICTSVKSPKENEWMIDPVVIVDIYGPKGPKLPWMVGEEDDVSALHVNDLIPSLP